MPNNKVEAYICGKRFVLQTQDSVEYVQKLARTVDEKFQRLFESDSKLTLFEASVLVSMDVLDQSVRTEKNDDHIRAQVKAYSEEASKLRAQVEKLEKELQQQKVTSEKLKAEAGILKLRNDLEKHSKEQDSFKQESLL